MAIGASVIRAGKAFVEITADDSKLQRGLKQAQLKLKAFGKAVQSVGLNMVAAGGAIVAPMAGAIKVAGDAAESLSRFNAVFGEQAEVAESAAQRMAAAIGRSVGGIRDAMGNFQSFFVGLGYGGTEARKLAEQLTELSLDFASFNNLSDEDAIGRFISALSGSSEVLDKYGINTKQAALQQELLAMGINKSWTEVTEAEKAMARFNVIMHTMGDQGAIGDAVRTQDSFNNQMKRLKGQIYDAAVTIGNALLPMATALVAAVNAGVKVFAAFVKEHKKLITVVAAVGASLTLLGAPLVALGATVTAASVTLGTLHTALGAVRTAMLATATATKALWAAMIANPAVAALAAVAVVVGAIAAAVALTSKKTVELTQEMTKLREEGDRQRSTDLARMERLKQLANKTERTSAETREAIRLKRELEERYGALGIEIDEETKKINNSADAFDRLANSMMKVATQELEAEIAETRKNIRKLTEEINVPLIQDVFPGIRKIRNGKKHEEMIQQRKEMLKQLDALQSRRKALLEGNKDALAGDIPPSGISDTAVQASQLDEEWSRRVHRLRLEQIENETQRAIAMINERYDHELKRAQEANADTETLGRIEQARALELDNLQRQLARRREQENAQLEHQLEMIRLRGVEDEHEREIAMIDARYERERQLAVEAGDMRRAELLDQMRAAEIAMANAREEARVRLDADQVASANTSRQQTIEELRLRATKKGYDLELALLQLQRQRAIAAAKAAGENVALVEEEFDLRQKLLGMQEGVKGAVDRMSTTVKGTFSAAAIAGMGYNGLEGRIAKATEETAKYTRRMADDATHNRATFT